MDCCWHPPVFQWCGTCQLHCQPAGWVSWCPLWSQAACWVPCLWPGTTSHRDSERKREVNIYKENVKMSKILCTLWQQYLESEIERLEVALHVFQLDEARGIDGVSINEGARCHHPADSSVEERDTRWRIDRKKYLFKYVEILLKRVTLKSLASVKLLVRTWVRCAAFLWGPPPH